MKTISLIFFTLFLAVSTRAQTVIENPRYGISTCDYLRITRIERTDSSTVLYFHVRFHPGNWISIPKETYIKPVGGSEKLFIKAAEGIPVNQKYTLPKSGEVSFSLAFPNPGDGVKKIDYGEANKGGTWFIYDIHLVPSENTRIPEWLQGNWFSQESGRWEASFLDTVAVYRNELWEYGDTKLKKDKFTVALINDAHEKTLLVHKDKNGSCLIGDSPQMLTACTTKPGIKTANPDEEFHFPLFNKDSAVYSGYLNGYTSRVGIKTFMVHVNDIIAGSQQSHVVEIDSTGCFSARIPLYCPQQVYVRSEFFKGQVFLEPGKSLFHMIAPQTGSPGSFFMGESSAINADLLKIKNPVTFDYQEIQNDILNMKPESFKTYITEQWTKDQNRIDSLLETGAIGKKAWQVFKSDIDYTHAVNLMSYKMMIESAYRKKNNIPNTARGFQSKTDTLTSAYYSFITDQLTNNPMAILSTRYMSYINRLQFNEFVRDPRTEILHANLKKYFDVQPGLGTDLMTAQRACRKIVSEMTPAPDNVLLQLHEELSTPFLADYIAICNNQIKAKIEANKLKTGYTVNEIPKTEADKLFESIIQKYRGKVILVDFWATWCSPCMSAMEDIKPLKEELAGKEVSFVYITNHTSPENAWKNKIPDIKGEHYRVSPDEWNYLSSKFSIGGIPFYVIVDKNGSIQKTHLGYPGNSTIKATLDKLVSE
jgi:thiol-disulfide isomerase/thioredoxin